MHITDCFMYCFTLSPDCYQSIFNGQTTGGFGSSYSYGFTGKLVFFTNE